MQVDTFVFQAPPEPLDEDIIEEPAPTIHPTAHAGATQRICPDNECELAPLFDVHYLWRAETVDSRIQSLDTKAGFQGVRDAPSQNLEGMPVHDPHKVEIEAPAPRRQVSNGPVAV